MPQKQMKPCNYPRCPNLTRDTHCDKHMIDKQNKEAENQRHYDKHSRDKQSTTFYKSKEWKRMRSHIFSKSHGLCVHCLKDKRIKRADMVHHLVEVKKNWNKRLDINNLISLCNSCHGKIDHYKGG